MAADEELLYNNHENFNQDLDDEIGDIVIGSETFRPSEILFELKREAYRLALDEFNDRRYEEYRAVISQNVASSIAFNYWLSEKGPNANNPINQLLHLKDCWEQAIFLIHALMWGEIRAKGINLSAARVYRNGEAEKSFNTTCIFSDSPKQLLENIKGVTNYSTLNELNLLCEQNISIRLIDDLYILQDNRNELSHRQQPTKEQALQVLQYIIPILKRVIEDLQFLQNITIARFDSFHTTCRFEIFRGFSLNREFEQITIDGRKLNYAMSNAGEQIMALWENEVFSLSPFMHFVPDESGHETYLCPFKARRNGKFWYEPVKLRNEMTFDRLQSRFDIEKREIQDLLSLPV